MPVTLELSQARIFASSPILRGPPPRIRSAIVCWGARSNSCPIARKRDLSSTISQWIRLHASLPGSVRPISPASQLSGQNRSAPCGFSSGLVSLVDSVIRLRC